jgi:hypothetical protein
VSKIDSILQYKNDSVALIDLVDIKALSIFNGHSLKPIHNSPILNINTPSYWQEILLFLVFAIYVLIRISEPKKILKIFISVFSLQEAKQLFRQEFKLAKRISLLLGIGFVLIMAFLIQITNQYFGLIFKDNTHLQQYLYFVIIVSLIYLIKFLVINVLSYTSSNKDLGKEYLFNVLVFSQTIGVVLFPFVICLQFTKYPAEWFLYPALVICAGFYSLRIFRSFIISVTEQNIGIIYIILYLCTLEILPMLVLAKFLLVNF